MRNVYYNTKMKIFGLLICFISIKSFAQGYSNKSITGELPLLELGAGVIGVTKAAYPGSSEKESRYIPIPAAVYRGRYVRADEDGGLRSRFFWEDSFEVNMSLNWNFGADSQELPLRAGMPDLDDILEAGPSLIWHFKKATTDSPTKISMSLPIRYAFSTDLKSAQNRGYVFNPFLYLIRQRAFSPNTTIFAGLGATLATQKYHDYYYSVAHEFATNARPSYVAKGGSLSSELTLGLAHNFLNDITIFFGTQYSSLHLNPNKDSVLLERKNNFAFAFGLIWWFYESEEKQNAKGFL